MSYFYMTSTCFPHRYRIFIWHQWFFTQVFIRHQWFFPWISCFYIKSMVFPIDIVFDMISMVLPIDIVFFYYIYLFFTYISYFYMTSMVFSYRYLLRHQWFCPYISYFHMTSTCFPHRYRIFVWHPLVFPIDIVFLHDIYLFSHTDILFLYDINGFFTQIFIRHQWFFPWISCFYMTSMVFPHRYRIWYDINGFVQRYRIFLWHLLVFEICIEFLYDINGFSNRYRIFIWHQWIFP